MKNLVLLLGFLSSVGLVHGQNFSTTITLTADADITPTAAELVTFGLPLAEGDLTNTDNIKVSIGATEQSVAVLPGMTWWTDNSIRSVVVQLNNVDMTNGDITLDITNELRNTANDITFQDPANGWVAGPTDKANMLYPRIFALHDPQYLADSRIIPPFKPAPSVQDQFEDYQVTQFTDWAGALDYPNSSGGNWLFDRSSAMYKAYMTTGRVEFLKEAFLAKQFYHTYTLDDGSSPAAPGGSGCWTWATVQCADGKYIYTQPAKLSWALVGDTSQWDNQLIIDMALQADLGWNQYGTRDPYSSETEGFTERGAGIVGLCEVNAYEITGDATVLSHFGERITSLRDMQQDIQTWDSNNGWVPKSGAFTHSVGVHEGNYTSSSAPLGNTDDRGFSPWMSENIADFLWQAYWVTGNTDVPEMLRLLGHAVNEYGFTTTYNSGTGQFDLRPEYVGEPIKAHPCVDDEQDTDLLYFGSAYAGAAALTDGDWYAWYTNTHNIETILTLAVATYFETDSTQQARLKARVDKLKQTAPTQDCADDGSTMRRWNWQHRSNSYRTCEWIEDELSNPGTNVSVRLIPNFNVFPNPFEERVTVDFGNYIEDVTIVLTSIEGRELERKAGFSGTRLVLDMDVPAGTYVLSAFGSGFGSSRLIVKR